MALATGWLPVILSAVLLSSTACFRQSRIPASLSDQEFARLIDSLSEPAGTFTIADNLVSNEPRFAENARWLRPTGGVYIGVGPEQNFSYIARLRPEIGFIVDIRRENRNLHLLYKALFELANDRADFVSRLFSRPRQPGLESTASAAEIFSRYDRVSSSPEQFRSNMTLVRERLVTRGFPVSEADLESIERAFRAFQTDGPEIHFWGSRNVDASAVRPSYRRLMTAEDTTGRGRSFLSSEDGFRFIKDLQTRNLIVPVVGDFAGPDALRRVGTYVREHADVIRAFYGSNVGVYLNSQQTRAFCRNLASLPAAPRTWFIESDGVRSLTSKLDACPTGPK
jgi:hypothetical protein